MNEKIEKAIRLLAKNLWSEKDLWKPVLLHSLRVWFNLLNNWYWEDVVLAGFLHDIIEDSDVWEKAIEEEFWKNVLDLIRANSKNYSLPKWEKRDIDLFNRCVAFWKKAMIIKWYDILDNYTYFSKTNEYKNIDRIEYLLNLFLEKIWTNADEIIFQELRVIKETLLTKNS